MIPDVTQQFHALPVCVEDQNIDIGLLDSGDLQVDSVGDIVQQQVEALLSAAHPEWKKFLLTLPDSDVQYTSVPPGLVFSSEKMPLSNDESQCQRNSSSPVIPLSVQQEQLDSIDQQAISESDWMVFQHHDIQSAPRLPSSTGGAPVNTSHPQLQAERLRQMSTETTDQTVPFGRHDSMCSMSSSCSDVKRERRSISEIELMTQSSSSSSSSPLLPTTLSSTHQPLSHAVRRGRPCLDDVCMIFLPHSVDHVVIAALECFINSHLHNITLHVHGSQPAANMAASLEMAFFLSIGLSHGGSVSPAVTHYRD